MSDKPMVLMETSEGDILVELNAEKAPKTVENFLKYVDAEHYDHTIFHRVINGFMIQGGGMDMMLREKEAGTSVENEADNGLKNDTGTLAMARTMDPHSASAQFFINVADNDFLNHKAPTPEGWGYAVFGKVVDGMDVVEKIKKVKTRTQGFHENVPVEPVTIISARRFEA